MNISDIILILFIFTGSFVSAQLGKSTITSNKDNSLGSIKFGAPDLSDEESQYSYMPLNLRCDACTAIVDRFSQSLQVSKIIKFFNFNFCSSEKN